MRSTLLHFEIIAAQQLPILYIQAEKGPVKLMQRVKIARSFLQSVSNQFHVGYHVKLAYVILQMAVKEFLKPTSKNGEIGCFNRSLLMEAF